MTLGQTLTKAALEAREALAAAEFAPDIVGSACKAAAAAGHLRCVLTPSQPVDITGTAAAKALTATLGKQQLTLTWLPRAKPALTILARRHGALPVMMMRRRLSSST